MPDEAHIGFAVGAADPVELCGVELRASLQHRRGRNPVERHADDGAVLGALIVDLVGHHHAARRRLVLHDDGRVARNVVHDLARQRARIEIVRTAN